MVLSRIKKFFNRIEKRQNDFFRDWIHWSAQTPDRGVYNGGQLPQIRRGLQLYSNLLCCTPLVLLKEDKEIDHPFLAVLKKPNRFQSRTEFFSKLVEGVLRDGNFYCYVKSHPQTGQIQSLLPFNSGQIWAYPRGGGKQGYGDSTNPIILDEPDSFYYMSEFGDDKKENKITRKYDSSDIWHLKSPWQSTDLLNGRSLAEAYRESIQLGEDALELSQKFSEGGMTGPLLLTGVESQDDETAKEIQQKVKKFFATKGQYLTLPTGSEIKSFLANQPAQFLQFLSSVSSLHLSRLLSIPIELLNREDASAGSTMGGQGLKEVFRFWVKTSGKAFLQMVSEKLDELVEEDCHFQFRIKSVQSSDMRELAQSVSALVQSGVLSPDEAKIWLKQ